MDLLEAIYVVLMRAGEPLHYTDITHRVIGQGLWSTSSGAPEKLIDAAICRHIRESGSASRIHRADWGIYDLKSRFLSPDRPNRRSRSPARSAQRQPPPQISGRSFTGQPAFDNSGVLPWETPRRAKKQKYEPSTAVSKAQRKAQRRQENPKPQPSRKKKSVRMSRSESALSSRAVVDGAVRILQQHGWAMTIEELADAVMISGPMASLERYQVVDDLIFAIYIECATDGRSNRFKPFGHNYVGLKEYRSPGAN